VLSSVKLIAEPWDTGPGGYQVGNFPPGWAEWNDQYRDTVRRFWKGDDGQVPSLASRISGSADIYAQRGRRPWASVNFATAHDGFTLRDLVSYNEKHNEANKEDNRDGNDNNHGWNCGVEGETDKPDVLALRRRQVRNFLATLLLSQGTPMLLGGDERGRTQRGNNNAYCQDSELSWLDWSETNETRALLLFTRNLIRVRRRHIVFHRNRFFHRETIPGTEVKDVMWLRPDGAEMTEEDWKNGVAKALGLRLSGEAGLIHLTALGEQEPDDTFLILMNASHLDVAFRLPQNADGVMWKTLIDTAQEDESRRRSRRAGKQTKLRARSLQLLVVARPRGT
jgi:glycogen operon protein